VGFSLSLFAGSTAFNLESKKRSENGIRDFPCRKLCCGARLLFIVWLESGWAEILEDVVKQE
jgi:hypothetical protein